MLPFVPLELDPIVIFGVGFAGGTGVGGIEEGPVTVWPVDTEVELWPLPGWPTAVAPGAPLAPVAEVPVPGWPVEVDPFAEPPDALLPELPPLVPLELEPDAELPDPLEPLLPAFPLLAAETPVPAVFPDVPELAFDPELAFTGFETAVLVGFGLAFANAVSPCTCVSPAISATMRTNAPAILIF